MRTIIIDIETVPAELSVIEAAMPADVREPVMPPEIATPTEPNWEEKCPAYASIKVEADRAAKRTAWIDDKRAKFAQDADTARDKWRITTGEARVRFIEDAALDARLGVCKVIASLEINEDGKELPPTIFVHERDRAKLNAAKGVAGITLREFYDEEAMLRAFFLLLKQMAGAYRAGEEEFRIVTYYGHQFDFPFLYRRAWLNRCPVAPLWQRGRYFTEPMIDLHERWQMGDREARTGGLEGLAKALGVPGFKTGDGKRFGAWWEADPAEGIAYAVQDLKLTAGCARAMGVC